MDCEVKVVSVLLAMAVSAAAATSDPGETAVRFLEKVRTKNLNLEPGADTALSPQTLESKRREIARRLERMARDLGNDPLEVGAMKLDGDLAGVLVRKISDFNPNRMQVFPIALVKRDAEWLAAPVPASFENTGVGYTADLRKRLKGLENWMLHEQVLDLANLRDQSAVRLRRKIEEALPAATLRKLDSQQVAARFLAACETRNLPEMFGFLGGLESHPPSDWPQRIKAAESALAAKPDGSDPWRLLVSKDVLRMIVLHDEDGRNAMVSIGCLDPAGGIRPASRPRIRLVHLEMTRSKEGLWRIDLPSNFLQETENPDDSAAEDLDSDLLDAFPVKLGEAYPTSPQPTAEDARKAVVAAIQEGELSSLIRLIHLDGDPQTAREDCIRASQLWWAMREPSSVRHAVPLATREDEKVAAATFQFFSARNPDHLDFKILYFEQRTTGWLWTPKPSPETEASFREWTALQAGHWRDHWQEALLADSPPLNELPETKAPPEKESCALIDSWFQSMRAGDVTAALRLTTRLNLPDSTATLLRNLGYELTGARMHKQTPSITGVYRADGWTAVGTRFDSNGEPSFPLYPVVTTPSGPRILMEVDLAASTKRSRNYLNKTALKRLAKSKFNGSAATLEDLLSQHQAELSTLKNR